jgi:Orsellinic acid/F9775 biosynthesis cluster protein D
MFGLNPEIFSLGRDVAIPISLDSTYNMVICNECNIAVPYNWILGHLKGNHGIKVTLEEVAMHLNIEGPTMTSTEAKAWISEIWIISRPVEGVPIIKGLKCSGCNYSSVEKTAMKTHCSEKHKGQGLFGQVVPCMVQCPFKGQLNKYIQVEQAMEEGIQSEENEWKANLKEEVNQILNDSRQKNGQEEMDSRLMGVFFAKIRWDLSVQDVDKRKLTELSKVPTIAEPLFKILTCGRNYIRRVCKDLSGGNMIIRRSLMDSGYIFN